MTTDAQGKQASERPSSAAATDMVARLLDAAENLYGQEGPAALTNRRIAAEAGTTTQSIYTYFGGQDHLIDAMWRRAIDGVSELLDLALEVGANPSEEAEVLDALFLAAHAYRDYCVAHPGRFRLIQRAGVDVGTPADAAMLREKVFDHLASFGEENSKAPAHIYPSRVRLSLAAIHGLVQAEIDGFVTERDEPRRLLNELVHRFFVAIEELPPRRYPDLG